MNFRLALIAVVLMTGQLQLSGCSRPTVWEKYNEASIQAMSEGNFTESEKQLKLAIAEAEKFGADDPRLAGNLNNLGSLYFLSGRYQEAQPLYLRALEIRRRILPPDDADLSTSLYNLGSLYIRQGRYLEAEPLYRRSLHIQEKVLGPDHPYLVTSLEQYADLLRNIDRRAEADRLLARAAAIKDADG